MGEIAEPKRATLMGIQWKLQRESDRLTLKRPAQGIDEGIHQGSKVTKLKLSPYKNEKHHRTSTHRR